MCQRSCWPHALQLGSPPPLVVPRPLQVTTSCRKPSGVGRSRGRRWQDQLTHPMPVMGVFCAYAGVCLTPGYPAKVASLMATHLRPNRVHHYHSFSTWLETRQGVTCLTSRGQLCNRTWPLLTWTLVVLLKYSKQISLSNPYQTWAIVTHGKHKVCNG